MVSTMFIRTRSSTRKRFVHSNQSGTVWQVEINQHSSPTTPAFLSRQTPEGNALWPRSGILETNSAALFPQRLSNQAKNPPRRATGQSENGKPSQCVASSCPFSAFSWHSMQWRVHGTASNRLALISLPQETHSPKLPSRIRASALSTNSSSWRSLLLWLKRNSLL